MDGRVTLHCGSTVEIEVGTMKLVGNILRLLLAGIWMFLGARRAQFRHRSGSSTIGTDAFAPPALAQERRGA
jgi:hypothetical protein